MIIMLLIYDNNSNNNYHCHLLPHLKGHLIHRFGITESDWHRIKQNIDSKCRTAWRRRVRGMPLTVKAFRGKAPPSYVNIGGHHMGELSGASDEDSLSQEDGELQIHQVPQFDNWGFCRWQISTHILWDLNSKIPTAHMTNNTWVKLPRSPNSCGLYD